MHQKRSKKVYRTKKDHPAPFFCSYVAMQPATARLQPAQSSAVAVVACYRGSSGIDHNSHLSSFNLELHE